MVGYDLALMWSLTDAHKEVADIIETKKDILESSGFTLRYSIEKNLIYGSTSYICIDPVVDRTAVIT